MLSFLLFSDLHLGAIDGAPVDDTTRFETFHRICSIAKEHDLLLIAGDLFNGNPPDATVSAIADALSQLAAGGVKVLMVPGECEIDEKGKVITALSNLSLAALFSDPVMGSEFFFEKGGERIRVYGLPGTPFNKLPFFGDRRDRDFTIGLFHGEVCLTGNIPETRAMVLQKNEMMNSGIDFFALGHHHHFKLFKHNRKVIGAYAGSPEPVTFDEKGERFVLSFTVSGGEIAQIKRLTVNSITAEERAVSISDFDSMQAFCAAIEESASTKKALRAILRGTRNFPFEDEKFVELRGKFYRLVVDDVSEPSLDVLIEQYRGDSSFRGDFMNLLAVEYREGKIPPGISPDEISRVLWQLMKESLSRGEDRRC